MVGLKSFFHSCSAAPGSGEALQLIPTLLDDAVEAATFQIPEHCEICAGWTTGRRANGESAGLAYLA